MKKALSHFYRTLPFALYFLFTAALSGYIIKNLADIFRLLCPALPLDESTAAYVHDILYQLKTAVIRSNILLWAVFGAAFGLALSLMLKSRPKASLIAVIMITGFIPFTFVALWFTQINEIQLGLLIKTALPIIKNLL